MIQLSQLTAYDLIDRMNLGCQFAFFDTCVYWTLDDIAVGNIRGHCSVDMEGRHLLCYNCDEMRKLVKIWQSYSDDEKLKHDLKNEIWICEQAIAKLDQKIKTLTSSATIS